MNKKVLLYLIATVFICNNWLFGQTEIHSPLTLSTTFSNGSYVITSDLSIQSGAEITFENAQISIYPGVQIIIEPECKLNIFNGSTLTASGLSYWQGIVLKGIPTASHVSGNDLNPQ